MSITIELTEEEEARLRAEAERTDTDPAEYMRRLWLAKSLIERDEQGRPFLAGTRIRVSLFVECVQTAPYTPAQIVQEVFPHLSLDQVLAALTFYEEHTEEIERERQADRLAIEASRAQANQPSREAYLRRRSA
jgi:uncharacterized protein (DUF433 family)